MKEFFKFFWAHYVEVSQLSTRKILIDTNFLQSRYHQEDADFYTIKNFVVFNCETSTKCIPKNLYTLFHLPQSSMSINF